VSLIFVVLLLLVPLLLLQLFNNMMHEALDRAIARERDPVEKAKLVLRKQLPFAGARLIVVGNVLQMPVICQRVLGKHEDGTLEVERISMEAPGYWESSLLRAMPTRKVGVTAVAWCMWACQLQVAPVIRHFFLWAAHWCV
jgi:hypothetical protein